MKRDMITIVEVTARCIISKLQVSRDKDTIRSISAKIHFELQEQFHNPPEYHEIHQIIDHLVNNQMLLNI